MKIYRNFLIPEEYDGIRRESDIGSDDKQKYDVERYVPFIPKKFETDIMTLMSKVGTDDFVQGLTIEISLAEMYELCPHKRRRGDTYDKLVAFLKDELGINLIINDKRYGSISNYTW